MVSDKRVFIVSNLHRDEAADINNDITITLPDSIFSGKVEAINMRHLFIDYGVETIGTSNYEFAVTYPETSAPVQVTLDINKTNSIITQTDDDIAKLIQSSINSALGTTVFQVFFDRITIHNRDIYRDNSDLLSSYTIFTSNGVNFTLDMTAKNSIGPLLGFGYSLRRGTYTYRGGNIPPLYAYESIYISNKAFDPTFKEYDQLTDLACKMDLYDSNDKLILNHLDERDTTISLPITSGYITSAHEFIRTIETELNRYSNAFANNPTFSVDFDLDTYRFTISNSLEARFGIGFRFDRLNGANNYGSLHRHLGFQKRLYLGVRVITSTQEARIFDRAYTSEYVFVCSDLIKYNYDSSLIVAESNGAASQYECLFAIPTAQIVNGSYTPAFEDEYRVRIHASKLAKLYNEDLLTPKTINFFLKISSGRHIKLNTQWSLKFDIEYTN